jgi:K(+)-stimulated pyrophosphate-energized sodium pump
LHAATVVGDTVGDPFKDTTSVALNPIIKFSTLFGLLAVEIAVNMKLAARAAGTFDFTTIIGLLFLAISLVFVYRSFYSMRITSVSSGDKRRARRNVETEVIVHELVEEASERFHNN